MPSATVPPMAGGAFSVVQVEPVVSKAALEPRRIEVCADDLSAGDGFDDRTPRPGERLVEGCVVRAVVAEAVQFSRAVVIAADDGAAGDAARHRAFRPGKRIIQGGEIEARPRERSSQQEDEQRPDECPRHAPFPSTRKPY